jgi:putative thioredoxin
MTDLNLAPQKQPAPPLIADTGTDTFEKDVLHASMQRPVIVDFWAQWCGPCRQMMPVLEKAVAGANGAVAMVKVDIDKNPELAQVFRVQSVPMVYAFFQGQPVDGFLGVKPESEIKAFVAKLSKLAGAPEKPEGAPAGDKEAAAKLTAEGDQFFRDDNLSAAMERYGAALEADASSARALSGIGWCLFAQGDLDSVREIVSHAEEGLKNDSRVKGLAFALARAEEGASLPAPKGEGPQALYDAALKSVSTGDLAGAIDSLVTLTRRDREWQEQKARKLLLDLFEAMGPSHPLTSPGRRKLSAVLFS